MKNRYHYWIKINEIVSLIGAERIRKHTVVFIVKVITLRCIDHQHVVKPIYARTLTNIYSILLRVTYVAICCAKPTQTVCQSFAGAEFIVNKYPIFSPLARKIRCATFFPPNFSTGRVSTAAASAAAADKSVF